MSITNLESCAFSDFQSLARPYSSNNGQRIEETRARNAEARIEKWRFRIENQLPSVIMAEIGAFNLKERQAVRWDGALPADIVARNVAR